MKLRTFGELYDPAMEVTTKDEADQILQDLVTYTREVGKVDGAEALRVVKQNLGYWAGYYDEETRRRVENLFDTEHPFLGRISITGTLTPEQIFELGKKAGERARLQMPKDSVKEIGKP